IKTTDGGENWLELNSLPRTMQSIIFVNADTGWVVGEYGFISKTEDGGQSWTQQTSNTTEILYSTYFINDDTGWIGGKMGTILKTVNGGADWVDKSDGTTSTFSGIHFFDADTGWAVGGGVKTTDGGDTWTLMNINGNDITFVDENNGWIVHANDNILNTTDGGINWSVQNGETYLFSNTLNDVEFYNDQIGWAVGSSGNIMNTTDGGTTWTKQTTDHFYNCDQTYSSYFLNADTGWVVGEDGYTFRTLDGGYIWDESIAPNSYGYDLYDVFFIDADTGWVVGNHFNICKTEDGGVSWTQKYKDLGAGYYYSVHFVDKDTGWVVGTGGLKYTTDGGENWSNQTGANQSLYDIYFVNSKRGWAVGNNGYVISTSNGGTSWETQTISTTNYLYSVHFIDSLHGLISSTNNGEVFSTIDGGTTWRQNIDPAYLIQDVILLDTFVGFASGSGIFKTIDGGLHWIKDTSAIIGGGLNTIIFHDNRNCTVLGNYGQLIKGSIKYPLRVIDTIPNQVLDEDFIAYNVVDVDTIFEEGDTTIADYNVSASYGIQIDTNGNIVELSPLKNYNGVSTVTVTATDDFGYSVSTSFEVTINPINDTTELDSIPDIICSEDVPVYWSYICTLNVATYINDPDNSIFYMSAEVLNSDNLISEVENTYAYFTGVADSSGIYTVVFTITPDSVDWDTDTITITVLPTNDNPYRNEFLPDFTISEDAGEVVLISDLYQYFRDADLDSLTFTAYEYTEAIFRVSGDSLFMTPTLNYNGTFAYSVTATDTAGLDYSQYNQITVKAVNDAPYVDKPISDTTLLEGFTDARLGSLYNMFNDVDSYLSEDFVITGSGNVVTTELDIFASMMYYVKVNPIVADAYGIDTIIVTITDDSLASVSDSFIVTVQNVNDAPIAGNLSLQRYGVVEDTGSFFVADLDTAFTDIDNAIDELTYKISTDTNSIIATIINDSIQITTKENAYGSKYVYVKVYDGVDSSYLYFYIDITPVNDPPIILDIPDFSFDEDVNTATVLSFYDYIEDVDNIFNDLDVTFNSITYYNHYMSDNYGEWENFARVSFIGPKDWYGNDTVEMILSDGSLSDTTTFIITVNPINDAPEIYYHSSYRGYEDSLLYIGFFDESYYTDVDNIDSLLTFEVSVEINAIDENGYYDAPENWNGTDFLTLIVSDGLLADTAIIPIYINSVNDPPIFLVDMPDTSWLEDMQLKIPMDSIWKYVYDPDNDTSELEFIIYSRDQNWMVVEIVDNEIVFSPQHEDWYGTVGISYAITDPSTFMIPYQHFEVTVLPVNDVPEAFSLAEPADESTIEHFTFNFSWYQSGDPDWEDQEVSYTFYLSGGDLDTTITGLLSYNLEFDGNGILEPGIDYTWYIESTDGIETVESNERFTFTISSEAVNIRLSNQSGFSINSFPNPFSLFTTFEYNLPVASNVKLIVYDITGQEVATILDNEMPSGLHTLNWNGKNNDGNIIQSGIYIYRLSISDLNGDALYKTERRLMYIK
ncbi:YCF48-related protein, partial [Bacteroidota bacterium]